MLSATHETHVAASGGLSLQERAAGFTYEAGTSPRPGFEVVKELLPPTHCSRLSIMCTEEADDPSSTADIQNHFIFQGFFILQDNVVVLSRSWLVCQHLQVKFLGEIHMKGGSLPAAGALA